MSLTKYQDFAPTEFDPKGLNAEQMGHDPDDSDRSEWLLAPVAHTRDSGALEESNWEAAVEIFEDLDAEGRDHEEHRFGHWGSGWFEIILVRPGSPCEAAAEELRAQLEDYSVLDEAELSRREHEEAEEAWEWLSLADRVAACQHAGVSIFAARRNELPPGVEYESDSGGTYFPGIR